ncbi:hypothetical protein LJC34_02070 [Oscillospiraceae bacterium OttesenSCG-928-G22]|nr:hypothetical protein [Oscillospiraceae bacterium OttesenSCG-928-G22]
MRTFKRTTAHLMRGVFLALCAGFLAYLIASAFAETPLVSVGIPIAVLLLILYMTFISENIRFEAEGDTLRYYKKNALVHTFHLPDCTVRPIIRSGIAIPPTHDIRLVIRDPNVEGGRELRIDCTPLGKAQFDRLFELVEPRSRGPSA